MHDINDSGPSSFYFSKIKALGYAMVKGDRDNLTIPPLRPEEPWQLRLREDRWILYVHDTPQISFLPEEAIRFLVFRKFPSHAYRAMNALI